MGDNKDKETEDDDLADADAPADDSAEPGAPRSEPVARPAGAQPEDIGLPHITSEDEGLPSDMSFLGLAAPGEREAPPEEPGPEAEPGTEADEAAPPVDEAPYEPSPDEPEPAVDEEAPVPEPAPWPEPHAEDEEAPWTGEEVGEGPSGIVAVLVAGLLLLVGGLGAAAYAYVRLPDHTLSVAGVPLKTWFVAALVATVGLVLLAAWFMIRPAAKPAARAVKRGRAAADIELEDEERIWEPLDERLEHALKAGLFVRGFRIAAILLILGGFAVAGYYYALETSSGRPYYYALLGTNYSFNIVGGGVALVGFVLFLIVQSAITARERTRAEVLLIVKEAELDRLRIQRQKERKAARDTARRPAAKAPRREEPTHHA